MVRAVARAKPLIPDAAWPVLTTMRSLVGDGPLVGTPPFRRVLALCAHPDDESVGCGGLLALLADAGAVVEIAYATDGEATIGAATSAAETGRLRRAEAEAACEILGTRPPRFFGHPDGGLDQPEVLEAMARDLRDLVADTEPEAVVVPWFLDGHADHRAVSAALGRAGVPPATEIWGYESWSPLPPNRLVDVTSVFARKEQALAAYATAHLAFDVSAMLGLNRYRSVHGLLGRGYAEAYLAAPASHWFDL